MGMCAAAWRAQDGKGGEGWFGDVVLVARLGR